jgi:hypothetical protein
MVKIKYFKESLKVALIRKCSHKNQRLHLIGHKYSHFGLTLSINGVRNFLIEIYRRLPIFLLKTFYDGRLLKIQVGFEERLFLRFHQGRKMSAVF